MEKCLLIWYPWRYHLNPDFVIVSWSKYSWLQWDRSFVSSYHQFHSFGPHSQFWQQVTAPEPHWWTPKENGRYLNPVGGPFTILATNEGPWTALIGPRRMRYHSSPGSGPIERICNSTNKWELYHPRWLWHSLFALKYIVLHSIVGEEGATSNVSLGLHSYRVVQKKHSCTLSILAEKGDLQSCPRLQDMFGI